MEYIIISILLGVIVVLSYFVWRLLTQIQNYESSNQSLFLEMNKMAGSIAEVLSKDVYSNDPVIVSFVENLKDIEFYIKEINPELYFNELGEKTDG